MNRIFVKSAIAVAALLTVTVALSPIAKADEVSNANVQGDVKKAISTLDDMQKLGREIKADHAAAVAAAGRGRRNVSGVRPAAVTTTTTGKKAAGKKAGGKNANTKKAANGKAAGKKKKTGN